MKAKLALRTVQTVASVAQVATLWQEKEHIVGDSLGMAVNL